MICFHFKDILLWKVNEGVKNKNKNKKIKLKQISESKAILRILFEFSVAKVYWDFLASIIASNIGFLQIDEVQFIF